MLNNIIEEEDDCFVFFYESVDPDAHAILAELEGKHWGSLGSILNCTQALLDTFNSDTKSTR